VLRVLPSQEDEYTIKEIELAYIGHIQSNKYAEQAAWERARLIAYYSLQPHTKKLTKPQQLLKFDWEAEGTVNIKLLKAMENDKRFPKHI